jgi:hypothetical protein
MQHESTQSLLAYFVTKSHQKILSSFIISCLDQNTLISPQNFERISIALNDLIKLKFFDQYGQYSLYENLINELFAIINTINFENGVKSYVGFSKAVKIKIDKKIDSFHGFVDCQHEATIMLWNKIINEQILLDELKVHLKEFLEIFDQNIVDVISDFLKKLIKFLNIKRSTWKSHYISPQNLDDFFQNIWFTNHNKFFLQHESFTFFLKNVSIVSYKHDDFKWADERTISEEDLQLKYRNFDIEAIKRITSRTNSPKFHLSSQSGTSEEFSFFLKKMTEIYQSDDPQDIAQLNHEETNLQRTSSLEKSRDLDTNQQLLFSARFKSQPSKDFRTLLTVIEGPEKIPFEDELSLGSEIEIFQDRVIVNHMIEKKHNHLINFGRKSQIPMKEKSNHRVCKILFSQDDKFIGRSQFFLNIQEKDVFIQCVSPPPKPMTAFKICDNPFYLRKNNVNSKKPKKIKNKILSKL